MRSAPALALDVVAVVGDVTPVQNGVLRGPDVDEGRFHAGQDVLHPAAVDVADDLVGVVLRTGHEVLDERPALEHGDVGRLALDVHAHEVAADGPAAPRRPPRDAAGAASSRSGRLVGSWPAFVGAAAICCRIRRHGDRPRAGRLGLGLARRTRHGPATGASGAAAPARDAAATTGLTPALAVRRARWVSFCLVRGPGLPPPVSPAVAEASGALGSTEAQAWCRRSSASWCQGRVQAVGDRGRQLGAARTVGRLGRTGRAFGRVRCGRRAAGRRIQHRGDPFSRSRRHAARAAPVELRRERVASPARSDGSPRLTARTRSLSSRSRESAKTGETVRSVTAKRTKQATTAAASETAAS